MSLFRRSVNILLLVIYPNKFARNVLKNISTYASKHPKLRSKLISYLNKHSSLKAKLKLVLASDARLHPAHIFFKNKSLSKFVNQSVDTLYIDDLAEFREINVQLGSGVNHKNKSPLENWFY